MAHAPDSSSDFSRNNTMSTSSKSTELAEIEDKLYWLRLAARIAAHYKTSIPKNIEEIESTRRAASETTSSNSLLDQHLKEAKDAISVPTQEDISAAITVLEGRKRVLEGSSSTGASQGKLSS